MTGKDDAGSMCIEIEELNHAAVHVRDLEISMRFYSEVLGLRQIARPAFPFPGAWYALGAQELHLIHEPSIGEGSRGNHHFALKVADVVAAKAELELRGVTGLRGPMPRPDGALQLFFTDPDGYLIELTDA